MVTTVVVQRMQLTTRRTLRAAGAGLKRPHRHVSIAAVLASPFAADHAREAQIAEWMADLHPLADEMAIELRDALTADGEETETYGKGAIVGALGSQIDIPLVHLHASYLPSHYDVEPVVVPDGPRPDEV
ncbi:MAG TPA: hypothetical protein DEA70_06215, partial [Acidimicrobiaceae bacterium]|nr:hypothetical protein [Acidimicrobiaceae bacterium]